MKKYMSAEGCVAPRNFELEGPVDRSTLAGLSDTMMREVMGYVMAEIEHWTDDDGLHRRPFEKSMELELPEVISGVLRRQGLT